MKQQACQSIQVRMAMKSLKNLGPKREFNGDNTDLLLETLLNKSNVTYEFSFTPNVRYGLQTAARTTKLLTQKFKVEGAESGQMHLLVRVKSDFINGEVSVLLQNVDNGHMFSPKIVSDTHKRIFIRNIPAGNYRV